MNDLVARRRVPLAVAALVVALVTVALFRLPELFVSQLRDDAPLQGGAGRTAFWILVVVAIGQAAYAGFRILRPEQLGEPEPVRLHPDRGKRRRPTIADPYSRIASTVGWVAAGLVTLTLVYGVAMFGLTGLRAGFWVFVAIMSVQLLWYLRLTGDMLRWLNRQQDPPVEREPPWDRGDADYSPPIARGLAPVVRGR